jgi:hypothetical protein
VLRQQVKSANAKGKGRNDLRMPIPEYALPESVAISGGKAADEIFTSPSSALTQLKPS